MNVKLWEAFDGTPILYGCFEAEKGMWTVVKEFSSVILFCFMINASVDSKDLTE